MELGKEPGQDLREGVYTLPVLHALAHDEHREELARVLAHGSPDGELLDRALEIVRSGGSVDVARDAVTAEVMRATTLARRLPEGPASHALEQLAKFLAVRCGAGVGEEANG
jgi:heptaprenyl diphosphate synthase